jgi:hypothetical protein
MPGTTAGGAKCAKTNKEKYGEDYYKRIGQLGGRQGRTGGFASGKIGEDGLTGKQRAVKAGAKGGSISRRNKEK